MTSLFVIALFVWLPVAAMTSHVAAAKGLSAGGWALCGVFFGPLALLAVVGMPDRIQRRYLKDLAIKLEATSSADALALESVTSSDGILVDLPRTLEPEERILRLRAALPMELRSKIDVYSSEAEKGKVAILRSKEGRIIADARFLKRQGDSSVYSISILNREV